MITCTIDGKHAYPSGEDSIKITKENPFLKDRDAWTMEISFPMDILENARIFAHINRLDVSRRVQSFSNCIIYADDMMLIKGVGVVTQVTEATVKLQIKSGMSMIAYRSDFEKTYIDRLEYPIDDLSEKIGVPMSLGELGGMMTNYATSYIFTPIYDETNDVVLNEISLLYKPVETTDGYFTVEKMAILHKAAIQPCLRFVLCRVLLHMGYFISPLDVAEALGGLEGMYICNTRLTVDIAKALPHWTVKRFLDEVRQLFNITFLFNDADGTVAIKKYDPASSVPVSYECVDEFTTEYDEDGTKFIGSSNIKYNLQSSSFRICDDIPNEVLDFFKTKEYASRGEMMEAWEAMDAKERMTTIFRCPMGWHYSIKVANEDGEEHNELHRVGFQHLRRSTDDDEVVLNIVPVPMGENTHKATLKLQEYPDNVAATDEKRYSSHDIELYPYYIPCVSAEEKNVDEDYATVQSVIEEGQSTEQEEDEMIHAYYLGKMLDRDFDHGTATAILDSHVAVQVPLTGSMLVGACSTDPWSAPGNGGDRSFAFSDTTAARYIGMLHSKEKVVENQVQVVIKFRSQEIPDPTSIFIFRNKRYLCDKVEMNVTHSGVDEIKTGYFYEIT